jgi:hypothetical protein
LSLEEEAGSEEEAARYHDSPTLMHLLKKLSVSKAPKVVSFKPPHNGPVVSGCETFDLSPLQGAMWEARQQRKDYEGIPLLPYSVTGESEGL